MATLDILETGLVYRGCESHGHLRNAYFPSVVQTSAGDLVAAMDIGATMSSQDTRSYTSRSNDGGRTWSAIDRLPAYSVAPQIRRLDNDTLVLSTGRPGIFLWLSDCPGSCPVRTARIFLPAPHVF